MARLALVVVAAAAALPLMQPASAQSTGARLVVDPLMGVALGGFDPVSYFTEGAPLPGRSEYEHIWQGVPHYFANAANRDVFARNPEIYAPRFGGHCAMALSRGYFSDGKPQLHVIHRQRLYLFHSIGNRSAFLAAPDAALERAETNWSGEAAGPAPD
ncbi:hypothetical protein EMQ25_01715 [Arsenicitalea aurantiaca]|uniref:YHS domain-containing protein n=1 Tax=Arsenicitalea aurantiaca TaxID=1783274 RepID=A0A433XKU4_9HYPH|nr:YHS domain-containing (seleno)protein [Arsenicitalea aurantiaca]RUT34706.1 hypothetical protein EMQ25_01715 [Arsenicitalea aurantiaca]